MAMPAQHCSVAQRSRLIPLSVSPSSDESGKQSLYPDGDPDRHQNLSICSLAHCQPSLKILCKSVWKLLRKVLNKQTDKQTDRQRRLHDLLGGGKNTIAFHSSVTALMFAALKELTKSIGRFFLNGFRQTYDYHKELRPSISVGPSSKWSYS